MLLSFNLAQFDYFCEIVTPILICVVLPIVIIYMVFRYRRFELDKRTQVMIKAIEHGVQPDSTLFQQLDPMGILAQKEKKHSPQRGLITSIILFAIGILPFLFGIGVLFDNSEAETYSQDEIIANGMQALLFVLGSIMLVTSFTVLTIYLVKKKSHGQNQPESENDNLHE